MRPNALRTVAIGLDVFLHFVEAQSKRPTVAMLSRTLLEDFMAWLARPDTSVHGQRRADVTIAKLVRTAQLMWIWAEGSDKWPGTIPRPRPLTRGDLPDSRPQPVVAPTWDEMNACVLACRGAQRKLATWLRYTGLRVGESMLFTWSDVDFGRGELTIRPELDKNKVGRIVPLSPHILDEIATWGKREGHLIPSGRRPGPREREARGRDMARAWARAKVREAVYKRRPDHAFRKGFKSELIAAGAHIDAVDFLQGHSLGAGSRGRYIDPSRLPLREAVALIPCIAADTNVVKLSAAAK
jgi:integrase